MQSSSGFVAQNIAICPRPCSPSSRLSPSHLFLHRVDVAHAFLFPSKGHTSLIPRVHFLTPLQSLLVDRPNTVTRSQRPPARLTAAARYRHSTCGPPPNAPLNPYRRCLPQPSITTSPPSKIQPATILVYRASPLALPLVAIHKKPTTQTPSVRSHRHPLTKTGHLAHQFSALATTTRTIRTNRNAVNEQRCVRSITASVAPLCPPTSTSLPRPPHALTLKKSMNTTMNHLHPCLDPR